MIYVEADLQRGFLGKYPGLAPEDLFEGDIKYNMDYRNVYTGVLENWLKTKSEPILEKRFEPL